MNGFDTSIQPGTVRRSRRASYFRSRGHDGPGSWIFTLSFTRRIVLEYNPKANEILVSYPEDWELIKQKKYSDASFYAAAMPKSQERPRPDEFYGLPPEINLRLDTYRMYRLFEPWPMPSIVVSWDEALDQGRVEGQGDLKVQLNLLGQAQAWLGQTVAVLWECYLNEPVKVRYGQGLIHPFWSAVENDMGSKKIFSQPLEPTVGEGYIDFLSSLGYVPDPVFPGWWCKEGSG